MKTTIAILCVLLLASFKQVEPSKIFISRNGLFTGAGGAIKIFIDETMVCELDNNSFSIHNLSEGKHKFNAQWMDKTYNKSNYEIEIEIKSGQDYYLQVVKQDKGLKSYANVQEITNNTWKTMQEKLKLSNCHQ